MARVVEIDYNALVSGADLSELIAEAYGQDGLGELLFLKLFVSLCIPFGNGQSNPNILISRHSDCRQRPWIGRCS